MPEIVPRIPGVKDHKFTQSPSYPQVPRNPFRMCLAAGTIGGKTTTILNMALSSKLFRNTFSAIGLDSPSLGVDDMLERAAVLEEQPEHATADRFWLCFTVASAVDRFVKI